MDKIKHFKPLLLLLTFFTITCSSCRYEEGPFINFTKVDNRIRGEWKITKIEHNGTTASSTAYSEEALGSIMDFYQTHVYFIHCTLNNTIYNCEGSWDFGDKKRSIIVNYRGIRQVISREYEIIKFKNNLLKVRYTDDNGDEWTITLTLLLSYIEYGY